MDEFIVTATLAEEATWLVPYSTAVIGEKALAEKPAASLPDALRGTAGVFVPRTANGQSTPIIRSFTGFRNLILLDGIRLNNSVFREGANQYFATVDPFLADRIEVVKGPASVLYGSDAIGGTVNVLTKNPRSRDLPDGQWFLRNELDYRWSSAEDSHQWHAETDYGKSGEWGLHLGISPSLFGDVRAAGLGRQEHTGYDALSFDAKLQFYLDATSTLTFAYQQSQLDDVWRTHSTIYGVSWRGTEVGSDFHRILDQTRRLAYVQYSAEALDGLVNRVKASLSWHQQAELQDRLRDNHARSLSEFDAQTLGAWVELGSSTPIGELAYGVSFYRDYVDTSGISIAPDGTRATDIQGPVGDDSTYDIASIFVQDEIKAGDHFEFVLGARYDHIAADIGRLEDPGTGRARGFADEWDSFVGSARALWWPLADQSITVFGGVSQAFRAPNLSDLSRLDSARSGEFETPSPGLEPERYVNYELGVRFRGERGSLAVTGFYTDIEDLIVRTPTGRLIDGEREVTKTNASDGYIGGVEVEAEWRVTDSVRIYANLAWNDGREEFTDEKGRTVREATNRLIPLSGFSGIRWDVNERLWFALEAEGADKADKLSTTNRLDTQRIPPGGTPGYVVLHARAGWQATEKLTLNFAVENLTDEEYRFHSSGNNQPGINFVVSARMEF